MRFPPNARRFRGRPPVADDDPLLAYRRAQGGATTDTPDDPLARFRAKHAGIDPLDVPAVSSESTSTRSPAPFVPRRTIGPGTLDPETDTERGVGRAAALYQGLTFGLGDKIQAGIKTVLPEVAGGSKGWDFRENLRNARTPLNDYRARHPIESTAAEMVGGLPTAMMAAPLSVAGRLTEAPAVARIAGLMGEGAAMGGTVGAFDAIQPDATFGDVGRAAAAGAATGAVVTPLAAPILSGVARGTARVGARVLPASVADRVAGFMGGDPVTPRGQAKAAFAGALESGGVNPAEAAKATGLIEPANPPAPVSSNNGRRFPVTEQTVTDYMAQKGLPREEAVRRLTAAGYDVPAATATPEATTPSKDAPMTGRPANDDIRRIADEYRYGHAIEGEVLPRPGKVDAEKAGVMAHAYEALKNDPTDPEVIAAYRALATETRAQADALMRAGYRPEFMTDDPYANSAEMMKDLAEKKSIRVFKTNKENPHPLLSNEENDLFRWVHDVFGHGQSGNQFGPLGEERAFRDHASMFSPEARRAMATETRGQDSWVNFGPNKDLPITERPFAEQKAAVMPRELTGDYGNIPRESPTSVMELGSRQVPALVRAARNVPTSTAGQTVDRFLSERAAGAGKRIKGALTEATGHSGSTDTDQMVTRILQRGQAEARPLYEEAYNHGPIQNPETLAQIRDLRQHPVMARAWMRGQALADLEAGKAPSAIAGISPERMAELQTQGLDQFLPKETATGPTVRQIDAWKKGLDAVIESGHGSDNALSKSEARVFRQRLNDVLAHVDREVPAYGKARAAAGDYLRTRDAAEAGTQHFQPKQDPETLARAMAAMSPAEREAYRNTGLAEVAAKIREAAMNEHLPEAGRSKNILQSLMGTADASERLGMLFPDEPSFESFKQQVEDEALYPKTDRFLRGQSTTNAQQAESRTSIKTWADLARSPFSNAARFRLVRHLMNGAMADEPLPPKIANEVAEMATTTGYRLRALLQEMASEKAAREVGRRRLLSYSNAALASGSAPAATEAERRRRTPPDDGR